jgi:Mg-chelatase subunit ChlD
MTSANLQNSILNLGQEKGKVPSDAESIKEEVKNVSVDHTEKIEELSGKLQFNSMDDKLMHSVLENDQEAIEDGKLISDSINQGIGSFTPNMMFEQMVQNYKQAKQIFGESFIRKITGIDPGNIERNIKVPEFQRMLKEKIKEKVEELKDKNLINEDGVIQEKGIELASLILYTEELDHIVAKGIIGEKIHKKNYIYGEKGSVHNYKKGNRYKDLAIKNSIKQAIRRKHENLEVEDLKVHERESKGQIEIMYAMDASGSMKGRKIEVSKKAGIALAYKAISESDRVGLIVFGTEVKEVIPPTDDFTRLLKAITSITASKETNFIETIEKAIELFSVGDITKHLLILTDAMPTVGTEDELLESVSKARCAGITVSIVGINITEKAKELAERIVRLGEGRLYVVKDLEELDKIILEDYYSVY